MVIQGEACQNLHMCQDDSIEPLTGLVCNRKESCTYFSIFYVLNCVAMHLSTIFVEGVESAT